MTISKAVVVAVAVLGTLVPVVTFAQYWGTNSGTSNLLVYVLVNNQNGTVRVPADFTLTVNGANPNPASFPGSQTGTPVTLASGAQYNVVAMQMAGFVPSYSVGCSGTLANGQQATCVITESASYGYPSTQPYPYPYSCNSSVYPYNNCYQTLTCSPAYQTVSAGAPATFSATGGIGTYTWKTAAQTYLNIGPALNVVLPALGTQTVVVTSGTQTATCSVNVSGTYQGFLNPPTLTIVKGVPGLPNTGFVPINWITLLAALLAVVGAALILPYAKSAVAATFR